MRWNGQGGLVCPLRGQSLESRLAAQRGVVQAWGLDVKRRKTPAEPWYAVRCVFLHPDLRGEKKRKHVYEERIIVVRAASDSEAIRKGEREAREYSKGLEKVQRLKFVETFHLFDKAIRGGTEVFSLMRSSNLDGPRFLNRYFDDGSEHRRS